MRKITVALALVAVVGSGAGCRPGKPVFDSTPENKQARGTIAGILRRGIGGEPVGDRQVTAVDLSDSSRRYSATTNVAGGFSIPVPPGKYRLEVELRGAERVLQSPGDFDINESDLDANRELAIGE
jgi:carboxypeptidase family protein